MVTGTDVFRMALAMSDHASAGLGAIARNIANADTPGYRAEGIRPFAEVYDAPGALPLQRTRPGHLAPEPAALPVLTRRAGDGGTSPNGNGVSIETEMVAAAQVRGEHDLALAIMRSSLAITRAGLGRT